MRGHGPVVARTRRPREQEQQRERTGSPWLTGTADGGTKGRRDEGTKGRARLQKKEGSIFFGSSSLLSKPGPQSDRREVAPALTRSHCWLIRQ